MAGTSLRGVGLVNSLSRWLHAPRRITVVMKDASAAAHLILLGLGDVARLLAVAFLHLADAHLEAVAVVSVARVGEDRLVGEWLVMLIANLVDFNSVLLVLVNDTTQA